MWVPWAPGACILTVEISPLSPTEYDNNPREFFCSVQKFKLFPKFFHLMANFLFISYLKTVLCCRAWFYLSTLLNTGSLQLKEHTIQQGQKVYSCWNLFKHVTDWHPRALKSASSCSGLLPGNARCIESEFRCLWAQRVGVEADLNQHTYSKRFSKSLENMEENPQIDSSLAQGVFSYFPHMNIAPN